MLSQSAAYIDAIVADSRRIYVSAVVDLIDPDIAYGSVVSSGAESFSRAAEIHDKQTGPLANYASLELNRWGLNGTTDLLTNDYPKQVGFVGSDMSDANGDFSTPAYVELQFSDVSILQLMKVCFSGNPNDGYAEDFTIEIKQGGSAVYTKSYSGNRLTSVQMTGFTVNNPDAIRITVTKWNMPYRRMRVAEIFVGLYEQWTGDNLTEFTASQKGNFGNTALPYGTCSLSLLNTNKMFEPRNKEGIFKSIEERQGVELSIGVELPDSSIEYKPIGTYYQNANGWKTGENGIVITWDLIDIVGLLSERKYNPPVNLPTTLGEWVASIVSQLGNNFSTKYIVDSNYSSMTVDCMLDDVADITCGDLLRYICMASGTWVRADATTGYLAVEPLWNQGNEITLDNIERYPVVESNDSIAYITFDLEGQQYLVSGNDTSSDVTLNIKNPFIYSQEQAINASKNILIQYGGNAYRTTGRGNPASEIGDVETIEIDESTAVTARLCEQEFQIKDGVLQGCKSKFIQADGYKLYENRVVLTGSGTWTAPEGVTSLRIILVGGGSGGQSGTNGSFEEAGINGAHGLGGKVFSQVIDINSGQSFVYSIGDGGAIGADGGNTVFGSYSSANGSVFSPSYTDIQSGNAYGRTGVPSPLAGSGDGGRGGRGGTKGDNSGDNYVPWGFGQSGVAGASGCIVVYYDL